MEIPNYSFKRIRTFVSTYKTENDADQNLTAIIFNATGIPMNQINALTEYVNLSSDSSLTDVIREQNGLTYGISFDHWIQGKINI